MTTIITTKTIMLYILNAKKMRLYFRNIIVSVKYDYRTPFPLFQANVFVSTHSMKYKMTFSEYDPVADLCTIHKRSPLSSSAQNKLLPNSIPHSGL